MAETDTVGDLKALVFSQTTIPVERQKILNLCKGKLPEDDTVLAHLNLQDRPKKEFNVLGTCSMAGTLFGSQSNQYLLILQAHH